MAEIAGLVFPFFGLIFIGFITAKWSRQPVEALGWLNVFIIYVALPALFYRLIARTPIEELTRVDFILANLGATYSIFLIAFVLARFVRRATIPESTIQGLAASYGNIGYMGPGIALLAFGERAAVPVALIFCFENMVHFIVAPAMMALSGGDRRGAGVIALDIARKIVFHPFILATAVGVVAAASGFEPPLPVGRLIDLLAQAAAPCALFAMGVTLALRPLKRVPVEITWIVPLKLVVHPLVMFGVLSVAGDFSAEWIAVAVLIASLPTATNVFVLGQQYAVWQERASAVILITTVISILSVSVVLYLFSAGGHL